jgi:hypothetical protein
MGLNVYHQLGVHMVTIGVWMWGGHQSKSNSICGTNFVL